MTATVKVNGVLIPTTMLDFSFGMTAYRGEVGTGHLYVDDPGQTYPIAPYEVVTAEEADAGDARFYTGYTAERYVTREGSMKTGGQRQWDITLEDANVLLYDRLIGSSGNRPEETDYQRVRWLLNEGSLGPITAGQVPNTATKTMGPEDYRGRVAIEVLEECSQRTGKNFYVYDDGGGDKRLFYDKQRNADVTVLRVSDVAADLDADTFSPIELSVTFDPGRQFHELLVKYDGGSVRGRQDYVPYPRRKEKVITNLRLKTKARALEHLANQLEQVEEEETTLSFHIDIPTSRVDDFYAGDQMSVRVAHAGLPWKLYRIRSLHFTPRDNDKGMYRVFVEMADKIRPTHVMYEGDAPSVNTGGTERIPAPAPTIDATVEGWQSWEDWERCYAPPDYTIYIDPGVGDVPSLPDYGEGDILTQCRFYIPTEPYLSGEMHPTDLGYMAGGAWSSGHMSRGYNVPYVGHEDGTYRLIGNAPQASQVDVWLRIEGAFATDGAGRVKGSSSSRVQTGSWSAGVPAADAGFPSNNRKVVATCYTYDTALGTAREGVIPPTGFTLQYEGVISADTRSATMQVFRGPDVGVGAESWTWTTGGSNLTHELMVDAISEGERP